MLKVFSCDIRLFSQEDFDKMYKQADRARKEKADRLKDESKRKLSLAADMLVRDAISKELGIKKEEIVFETNENGKPYAKGLDIHFSLSHSGDFVFLALSDGPVGIDAEKMRDVNLDIANRMFTEGEKDYVFKEEEKVKERFFEIWTKKEAYVKMLGGRVLDFLSFSVLDKNIETKRHGDYTVSISK